MKKLLCMYLFLIVCSSVWATDLTQPAWRGKPNSTLQMWGFGTNDKTPDPDFVFNEYGTPFLVASPTPPYWKSTWGGHNGVFHLSGFISADIPNSPVENPFKLVQIQLTWAGETAGNVRPCLSVQGMLSDDEFVEGELLTETDIILGTTGIAGAGEFWYHTTYTFKITPNPITETIGIGNGVWVDELIIDTICPEPATICLLGLGVLSLFRRKK